MYVPKLNPTNIYWTPLCTGFQYVVEGFDLASFLKKLRLTAIEKGSFTQTIHKEVSFFKSSTPAHISEFYFPYQQQMFEKVHCIADKI